MKRRVALCVECSCNESDPSTCLRVWEMCWCEREWVWVRQRVTKKKTTHISPSCSVRWISSSFANFGYKFSNSSNVTNSGGTYASSPSLLLIWESLSSSTWPLNPLILFILIFLCIFRDEHSSSTILLCLRSTFDLNFSESNTSKCFRITHPTSLLFLHLDVSSYTTTGKQLWVVPWSICNNTLAFSNARIVMGALDMMCLTPSLSYHRGGCQGTYLWFECGSCSRVQFNDNIFEGYD